MLTGSCFYKCQPKLHRIRGLNPQLQKHCTFPRVLERILGLTFIFWSKSFPFISLIDAWIGSQVSFRVWVMMIGLDLDWLNLRYLWGVHWKRLSKQLLKWKVRELAFLLINVKLIHFSSERGHAQSQNSWIKINKTKQVGFLFVVEGPEWQKNQDKTRSAEIILGVSWHPPRVFMSPCGPVEMPDLQMLSWSKMAAVTNGRYLKD